MNEGNILSYCCPHCGKPTTGRVIGKEGKKEILEMCKDCESYIGSPAANQEGATMKNRIKMERIYDGKRKAERDQKKTEIPPMSPMWQGDVPPL